MRSCVYEYSLAHLNSFQDNYKSTWYLDIGDPDRDDLTLDTYIEYGKEMGLAWRLNERPGSP